MNGSFVFGSACLGRVVDVPFVTYNAKLVAGMSAPAGV
jgi:hypothetical protein